MRSLHYLGDNIYWLTFDNKYDLCMHFWRVSEKKECPNEEMKQNLNLVDYMEWYAKKYGKGVFTYTNDWAGFNIPKSSFKATYSSGNLPDMNKYDKFMHGLRHFMEARLKSDSEDYYLIGTLEGADDVLKHEYAHALWGVNHEYKAKMTELLKAIDEKDQDVLCKNLQEMGYSEAVVNDEAQAYLSTGYCLKVIKDQFYRPMSKKQIDQIAKPFAETFKEFSEGKLLSREGSREKGKG